MFVLLWLFLFFSSPGFFFSPGTKTFQNKEHQVSGKVSFRYPQQLHLGFWPLAIAIRNGQDKERTFRLVASKGYKGRSKIEVDLKVPANGLLEQDVMFPQGKQSSSEWNIELISSDGKVVFSRSGQNPGILRRSLGE